MNISFICYGLLIIYWMLHLIKMISNFSNKSKYNIIPSGRSKQVCIELTMKLVYLVTTIYQLLIFYYNKVTFITIDYLWLGLGIFGIIGFALCMIQMKSNWHAGIKENKSDQLVTTGIYKYCRNPAFVSLYILYIALALLQNNIGLYVLTTLLIMMIHLQVLQEEIFLKKMFKEQYILYCLKTPRYLLKTLVSQG